jgi:hypothetical protein
MVNGNSGLCLGIQSGSISYGADAIQWGCNGHLDQEWF